jgi:hypothetical protein
MLGVIIIPKKFKGSGLFLLQSHGNRVTTGTDEKQAQKYGSNSTRPQHQCLIANAEIIIKIQAEQYK